METRKDKRKKYKAEYFQKNKEKIYKKRKENPLPKNIIINYHLKSRYGTSLEEIENLRIVQKGRCWICNVLFNNTKRATSMMIDHKKGTKTVRGLLCHNCNVALGHFKDNIEILKKAIFYLGGEHG